MMSFATRPTFGPSPRAKQRATRRRRARVALLVLLAAFVLALAPRAVLEAVAHGDITSTPGELDALPAGHGPRVAVVLGAGVRRDGSPTPLLADRIDGAIELYDRGLVDLLLMSADNQFEGYDEPSSMRARAIDAGVPPEAVVSDYAGRRTWDSCVRAREIFDIRSAIVVTNTFHAARSQVLCKRAGIDAQVYAIDESRFDRKSVTIWRSREVLAAARSLTDLARVPDPAVGGSPIDLSDPCARWESLSPDDPNRGTKPQCEAA